MDKMNLLDELRGFFNAANNKRINEEELNSFNLFIDKERHVFIKIKEHEFQIFEIVDETLSPRDFAFFYISEDDEGVILPKGYSYYSSKIQ